jgi:GT2 family glycosyltransferase
VAVTPAGAAGPGAEATRASLGGQLYRYHRTYDGAAAAARGDEALVLRVEAGDRLAPDALALLAEAALRSPEAVLFSYDEDTLGPDGRRRDPYFRPERNPDLLHGWNYLGNAFAVRRAALAAVPDWPRRSPYGLALALVDRHGEAGCHHLPFVLYHRAAPLPAHPSPEDTATLAAHLAARGVEAAVTRTPDGYHRLVRRRPGPWPLVSLVVGTRDRVALLRRFLDGVRRETRYRPVELVVVDNQSREPATLAYLAGLRAEGVRVLAYDRPFDFAAMNNLGAAESRGEVVGFMNNDLAVLHPDWLEEMVGHALRPEVGAVGAKLRYPDGTLQHAGVILGIGGVGGHVFKGFPARHPGYFGSTRVVQALSAVTAACLVMRRAVFDAVGGFDAGSLPVAFNDVDLCLRVRAAGLRVVWTPHAELLHLESASRGSDLRPPELARFAAENRLMLDRWGPLLRRDPAYNPNLTLEFEDYALAPAPRVGRPWREPGGPPRRPAPAGDRGGRPA